MLTVLEAYCVGGLRLRLRFSDGAEGVVDLSGRLNGPVFRSLNDESEFARFELTDHTVQWPNGADFAPEYLRALLAESPEDGRVPASTKEDESIS
ncbi:MAG: DUF2442 domain-containing protein [Planctomycetota bacterium]